MKTLKFIFAVTLLVMQQAIIAQNGMEIEKGDKAFDDFDFEEAMYFYSVAHEASPGDAEITRKIANTYRRMGQIAMSAEWYRKTIEMDASIAEDMLFYAEALKNMEQYDEAIYWYEMYDKLKPGDSRATSHLADKFYYKDLFADTARYDMKMLKINNNKPTIGVTLFEDEKLLMSAIQLHKGGKSEESPYLDVYACELNSNKELVNPIKLDKKVNSKYHDGPVFYSFAEHKLYITRNNIKNGKPVRDKNGNVNLKIYSADYENGSWSNAQELKINDDGYSTGHACLSKDGQTMYLVSTREGGFGGSDIYKCLKSGNSWSEPINLGANVNSAGNEMFPFIDDAGQLYFASDGHAGLGGLDVFYSVNKDGVWQKSNNMGAPVNSAMDDFALVYDKESDNGYFCSNRGGKGDDNLYFYKHLNIERMTVAGTLKANKNNISLAGERIQIKKIKSGESLFQSLDEFERFEFSAEAGERVEISFTNAEYFDQNAAVMQYDVPGVINDPFINIGEKKIDLKKVPTHEGRLSGINSQSLASVSAMKPNGIDNSKSRENTSGESVGNDLATKSNTSGNVASKKAPVNSENYKRKIQSGDKLFAEKNYKEAKSSYISASAIAPGESYPKTKIREIDNIFETQQLAKKQKDYDAIIKLADASFDNEKWADALNQYQTALAMQMNTEYPTTQIERVNKIVAKIKEDALLTKPELAAKRASEFEKAEPVIDLAGMSIDNIVFDYNKALIRKEDMATLDQICKLMKENPNTKLMIRAHCDSRGSMEYNQSLSMSRAMAVQGYLMQKGIKRDRMAAEWFGEQRPLNGCIDNIPCSEGEFEINRRAEFKLVAKN